MKSLVESIKEKGGKVDKKALAASVVLMIMSWAALPIVYWLIVRRKKKDEKEVKTDVLGKSGDNNQEKGDKENGNMA